MDIVLSGIRSTGKLHLGNYYGALRNFIRMQEENRCYFFIADIHSLTTHPDPKMLHENVKNVLVDYLAAGIDPEKSVIYVQSDLPETVELYLYLNMHAYLGELSKTSSFKEKARKQPENVNAGLLTYPTLMAADILIHRADKVPVGKDQEQHLEMTRRFARRFNHFYGVEYFKEPVAYNFGEELVKIPGLDGSGKMGKSEGNAIYLGESPKEIEKKVKRALTDSGPTEPNSVKPDYIENLFILLRVVSTPEVVQHYEMQWNTCAIRYGDLKKQLAEDIIKVTTPIRERIQEIEKDDAYLRKVTLEGAERARESARKTIEGVREIVGFKPF
ncbi:Tryptophan-tRNA ligase [Proteiniphilum saccharofermentans]|uniref:Tryptophan--tRNA ligase n=1 Tax=Proteiniphilum saccharofermentans TaxID=1642647 RepID=A0A1R3T2U7_9BACT|nr:tryptophan--tRNA ligase [Proteiniphilum saccharofermentans]SCD22031.1 Tryptophan-tRNA ligase [Proteiniphilum saccharofermentans]SDZ93627.1 tryptophanyl-tRNA synthetase [Porphyromonadaceae bacterium KH3R12]SFS62888.1 tryptophanyl-tRNA synthetase [Porphyromonadaceae bacterium NLAE-zl-C104]